MDLVGVVRGSLSFNEESKNHLLISAVSTINAYLLLIDVIRNYQKNVFSKQTNIRFSYYGFFRQL